ncbi:MAG: hypothetical protein K0R57_2537 [Paenibacillaceae bacterium]|jgi:hypothetical protein|nr:hypothetical protein [Paenibacillaceae bacterium]
MNTQARKLFSLADIKYAWLLLLSILVCFVTYYVDEIHNPRDELWLSVCYFTSFMMAAVWSGANYAGHIRMNVLYSKQHNIRVYVDQLALSGEDKLELQNYLEDFACDLQLKGLTEEEAAKKAIAHFKVEEFLSMSKHTRPFETHGHHYLLGWGILAEGAALITGALYFLWPPLSLYLRISTAILVVYGVCLIVLFFIYKMLDALIFRKLRDYFS